MANENFQVSRFGVTQSSGRRFWYRLIERFFQRRVLYLLPVILLAGLGVMSVSRSQSDFRSTGVLNVSTGTLLSDLSAVRGSNTYSYETPAASTARKINELLRTDVFVQIVAAEAGLEDALAAGALTLDDIRETTLAIADGDTLLAVSSTAPSAQGAYQLVNATIDSYIQWVLEVDISDSSAAEDFYIDLLNSYDQRVVVAQQALDQYLITHPAPRAPAVRSVEEELEIQRLNAALTRAQDQYDTAQTGAEQARLETQRAKSESNQKLKIVDPPQIPDAPEPALQKNVITIAIFTMLGLMVAAAFLILSTLADRKIRSQDDLETIPGLEVVGVIPKVHSKRGANRKAKAATDGAGPTIVAA